MPGRCVRCPNIVDKSIYRVHSRGLLLGWEKHTHPEGINYYTDNGNRILTFVDPQVPENLDRLRSAFREIEALLPLDRRGENTHIVLSFTKKQFQQGIVQYYIADYASQQVCWVHDVDVQSIGLQPYPSEECRSQSQPPSYTFRCTKTCQIIQGSMLLSYFWTHVHHFPVIAPLDVEMETRSLIGALNRGRMPGARSVFTQSYTFILNASKTMII